MIGRATVLGVIASLSLSGASLADPATWFFSEGENSGACASTSTDLSALAGVGSIGVLTVCYAKSMGCRPEIGVALLKGNGYGRVNGRVVERQKMQVMADGRVIFEGLPTRTNYDNGYEVSLMASHDDASVIGRAKVIRVRVVSESKLFEFSNAPGLSNATGYKVIGLARENCR